MWTGFLIGTRTALYENGRESIALTLQDVTPASVGALIALFEWTVGFYTSLINVNAYDQPRVKAGKKAAAAVIVLQLQVIKLLNGSHQKAFTAAETASALDAPDETQTVFRICQHLAANPDRKVKASGRPFTGDDKISGRASMMLCRAVSIRGRFSLQGGGSDGIVRPLRALGSTDVHLSEKV